MKKIAKFGCALLAICSLASCASKCNFEKFQEKVGAIEGQPYATAAIKGTVKTNDSKTKIDATAEWKIGAWVSSDVTALVYCNWRVETVCIAEVEGAKYYAGSSFKYVAEDKDGDKMTYTWNKYGLLTSYSYEGTSIKISYKK